MIVNLIGCRGHYYYLFDSLAALPDLNLSAICSATDHDDEKIILERAAKYQCTPKVYSDYLQMLDTEKPAIVVISGPFELHSEMCIEALKRNIHIFCEKPLALTLEDLAKLENAWAKSNAQICAMLPYRYEPVFIEAHKSIKKGLLGKVKLIQAQKSYKLGKRPDYYHKRATYGGTLPWVGSHAFDWIQWMAEESEIRKIWACQNAEDNGNNGEMEIVAQCQMELQNGVIASVSTDYLRPGTAESHGDDRIRVAGTKGVLEIRDNKLFIINDDGTKEIIPEKNSRKIFEDFALSIVNGETAAVSSETSLAMTKMCLLAQKAADAAASPNYEL